MKNFDKLQLQISISALANVLGVHQRTLRIYDEKGILSPKRTKKNRRYYSLQDIKKAQLILFMLKNLGLNLAGVKLVFLLLEKYEKDFNKYFDLIREIADCNFDIEIQEENAKKRSRKGRK